MRIGITGHRGLDAELEEQVRRLLAEVVAGEDTAELTVVSCIADGPDAWIAELALDRGARLEVVVPAQRYREGLPEWHHPVYDRLLRDASEEHHTGRVESDEAAHMAGSELLVGQVDRLIAVWDGLPARGFGGTADVVAYARRLGVPVQVLWPAGARR
ncbi:hypothetical protein SAMN05216371_6547 [Streptomyces sp. TLI_053]|uniref:hypothetical protein n=1 Tax=Streptomyces sp. TLI_053 TaxID=1855352 RepID=UPI00087C414C|nr:hypothetical protein [Streptomyces sp. TLI_053]SDT81120.1 hypothetical protein SAMN05216371_6547 [Streptomyces sp. TLI_053]